MDHLPLSIRSRTSSQPSIGTTKTTEIIPRHDLGTIEVSRIDPTVSTQGEHVTGPCVSCRGPNCQTHRMTVRRDHERRADWDVQMTCGMTLGQAASLLQDALQERAGSFEQSDAETLETLSDARDLILKAEAEQQRVVREERLQRAAIERQQYEQEEKVKSARMEAVGKILAIYQDRDLLRDPPERIERFQIAEVSRLLPGHIERVPSRESFRRLVRAIHAHWKVEDQKGIVFDEMHNSVDHVYRIVADEFSRLRL
jgi:hypothetical protein